MAFVLGCIGCIGVVVVVVVGDEAGLWGHVDVAEYLGVVGEDGVRPCTPSTRSIISVKRAMSIQCL